MLYRRCQPKAKEEFLALSRREGPNVQAKCAVMKTANSSSEKEADAAHP